jgi:hypothetical protein
MDDHPWKVSLFVGHRFSRKSDNKPCRKFCMKKVVLPIYRTMLGLLVCDGRVTDFGALRISRCFGLGAVFTDV